MSEHGPVSRLTPEGWIEAGCQCGCLQGLTSFIRFSDHGSALDYAQYLLDEREHGPNE